MEYDNYNDDYDIVGECESSTIYKFPQSNKDKKYFDVKLVDSTIGHISEIFDYKEIALEKVIGFFRKKYEVLESTISFYLSNIIQFKMNEFFNKKKYEIVDRFWVTKGTIIEEPKMIIENFELDKTFVLYKKAFIFLENKKTKDKVVVQTTPNYDGTLQHYTVYKHENPKDFWEEWIQYGKDNNLYKNKKITPSCKFLTLNEKTNWNSIVLPDKIKKVIKRNVNNLYKNRNILAKNNISIKRGIILCGKPGTGKTMICKVLVNEMKMTVLYILPSDIRTTNDVSRICEMAKDLSPTLLILEDIDYITEDREPGGDSHFCIELMNRMDGLEEEFSNVITIATTNMIQKVEKAIKNRPGRFDKVIEIPVPGEEEREKMIKLFTKYFKLDKDIDIKDMVSETEGLPGAYIFHIAEYSAILAIEDKSIDGNEIAIVKQKHFNEAIAEVKDKKFGCGSEYVPKRRIGFE